MSAVEEGNISVGDEGERTGAGTGVHGGWSRGVAVGGRRLSPVAFTLNQRGSSDGEKYREEAGAGAHVGMCFNTG